MKEELRETLNNTPEEDLSTALEAIGVDAAPILAEQAAQAEGQAQAADIEAAAQKRDVQQTIRDAEAQEEFKGKLVDTGEEIFGQEGAKLLYDPETGNYYKEDASGTLRPARDATGALRRAIERFEERSKVDGQTTDRVPIDVADAQAADDALVNSYQKYIDEGFSHDFALQNAQKDTIDTYGDQYAGDYLSLIHI